MTSFEHLDALRRQNKELLQKLKHKSENLQRLNLDCSRKQLESVSGVRKEINTSSARDRTPLTERKESLLNVSDAFINLTVSGNRPKVARKALCKPINIKKTPNLAEVTSDCLTDEEAKRPSEDATCEVLLQDQGNSRPRVQFNPTGTMQPKSVISQDKGQRGAGRVRFPPADDELETVSDSERRRVQPLLGYDWIAGLLDAESSLTERSEHFFSELRTFRQVNKEECVHSVSSGLPVAADLCASSDEDDVTNHESTPDTHQCTFCYRINSRLFATPLDPQAACPVCKKPKEKHPHAQNEPAFIRVSIPRSTLLPAYRYKAHRRGSFDPSDSLGLPSHCLSGWSNISMGAGSEMSSLDLRSSMEIRPNTGTVPSAQPENQLIPPAKPGACPQCETGSVLKCEAGYYKFQRNGQARCNKCTTPCTEKKNLIQVTACTTTSDRSCQCKPGYYCPSPVAVTCRRDCEPCTNGFTSTSNLYEACKTYTDCARLGMVVIKEGSRTADRVCGNPTTHPNLNPTTTPSTPSTTTQRLPSSTSKSYSMPLVNRSVRTAPLFSSQNPVTSLSSETTAPPGVSAEFALTTGRKEVPVPPSEPLSKTTWIFLLLLLMSLCLVSCLSLKCKSRTIKNKLEWAGLAFGRHQPVLPTASPNPNMETLLPVSKVTDAVQGQGSFPGKNQQVTMEHVGKADGINNTVGSIFIYSPGMVILGSNSNEKKEEAETSGEDGGEDTCLMSVPQQESSSQEDFIRLATQEELGKELSIPVPATSK
ncbi:uncharacterized protein LOC113537836 isoform X2 [Pangasianodon hypophthalmus]|uniref:uncharacterized protein LOC113537836 isoform X2 n=1 Tax=Pangasianodon hypophthalmus TaxID=310915 RepID=UPI0023075376|nr:uncharacterized protein LOC113537836 isoform X2 [Pangasianodon hypophthalmus]